MSYKINASMLPLIDIFNSLYTHYGAQGWWPGDTKFEIMLGAILTQNTAWRNVTLAISNLKNAGLMEANALLNADPEYVKSLIAPSGFFNIKYRRLMGFLKYLVRHNTNLDRFHRLPISKLRSELLDISGIGPETADSILLYAFDRPIFVVDAYTRRLFSRLGFDWMDWADYKAIQDFIMENLPIDTRVYNEFHALIVAHCKIICKKNSLCMDCVLQSSCPTGQAES